MRGDLDAAAAPRLRQVLADLWGAGAGAVLVDIAGVPFIDAAGLRALVGGVRRLRGLGADVAVCGIRPPVERLVRLAGLDRVATLLRAPGPPRFSAAQMSPFSVPGQPGARQRRRRRRRALSRDRDADGAGSKSSASRLET